MVGSLKPNEVPITAKNVPGGVSDTRSTITSSPEIAHAEMNPASEHYMINNFGDVS